jgi:hypothetical protein
VKGAGGFFASVNGAVLPAEEARVSVLDTGFTFGDSVYETLRTYGGRPFHLDRHLHRLRASRAGWASRSPRATSRWPATWTPSCPAPATLSPISAS